MDSVARQRWGVEFARQFAVLRPMAGFAAHTVVEGNGFYLFFVALFAVAGMMALISCANVAGLLTARGLSRRREMAIRKALGASRWQMARPLLAEASVLAAAGAAAGLLLEWFLASRLRLVRFPSAYGVPFEFHFRGDSGLLLYAAAAALVALAVSTLGPALSASRADLAWAIRQGEPALSLRRWNLRSVFVAVQMALAVMLLTVGALFVRSFAHVATADLGFDAAHILMAGTQPAPGTPSDYRERVLRGIESLPGVVSATSTAILPLAGELPKIKLETREVYSVGVGPRYFETMGIPICAGAISAWATAAWRSSIARWRGNCSEMAKRWASACPRTRTPSSWAWQPIPSCGASARNTWPPFLCRIPSEYFWCGWRAIRPAGSRRCARLWRK